MDQVDTCVVGGGVVGLAVARRLAAATPSLLVLDQQGAVGQGISSRNSEVIHAGIYYAPGSLKALLCVAGRRQLYAYCQARQLPHRRLGKLIVATTAAEESALALIQAGAEASGVDDLAVWSAAQVARAEPAVKATLALHSPATGIVSAHDFMQSLLADIEQQGGSFVGHTRVERISRAGTGFVVHCQLAQGSYQFACLRLVNAAGLGAQALAGSCEGVDPVLIPALHLCKGDYFSLTGRSPFQRLIYPVPEASGAGLGVHATLDMGGMVKFGPDVEYVENIDFAVSADKREAYFKAIGRYYPQLDINQLVPAYAGIRPKLQGPGEAPRDFDIQGPAVHGIAGLVQLFGIESPGLTAALAIAEHVQALLAGTETPYTQTTSEKSP
jgi:L-2-hydroxyglutarate oxidase LhgO